MAEGNLSASDPSEAVVGLLTVGREPGTRVKKINLEFIMREEVIPAMFREDGDLVPLWLGDEEGISEACGRAVRELDLDDRSCGEV